MCTVVVAADAAASAAAVSQCSPFRNRIWDGFGVFGLFFQYDNVYFLASIALNSYSIWMFHFVISNFQRFDIKYL